MTSSRLAVVLLDLFCSPSIVNDGPIGDTWMSRGETKTHLPCSQAALIPGGFDSVG